MNQEVRIALGAAIVAAAVLYLEAERPDPCRTMNELAARYATPSSEVELQAIAAEDDALEAAVRRKRTEMQKMYAAMPARVARQYTTVTRRCAQRFRWLP